ncbi:uncharacterized protein LOC112986531 [Dromaius novaehollandiae]|uniref:uncharacterized protein LOC112986531 n=1 Tax=Dromaius novaehollandiae TaxID=8790 RepID=UPI00311DC7C6
MMEEINTICYFYESCKAKEKEDQKGNQGMKSSKETEATSKKDSILKELSEHHHHTEQTLCQKHLEEIKYSGLNQDLAAPKQSLHFLEEILYHLSICHPGLQIPHSNITEQEELHSSEAELSPNSLTQILHVSAVKIVKLEALRQACLYRVLDLYNNLQRLTFPEDVTRILNSLNYKSAGEEAAQEVAQTREKQQVARAVAFLQKHHQEGDLLIGLHEESEAELRNMKVQFRLELQTQTEEKMQAKEMQVIQEAEGQGLGNLVAYFILSQRHLRQTVMMLQDCYRLQKTALRSQIEGINLEQLVLKELSTDDDVRGILHLLKDNTAYILLVLEYIQAAQFLQLRESQFKETARSLKVYIQEKSVDEANITANELKKFREQKVKLLKDQLKVFLGNKRAEKNTSSNFDLLQNLMKQYSETQAFFGKDFHPDLEEMRLRLEGKERDTQQSNGPLSSVTESSWIQGIHCEADDQLLLFLTENIKVLKQAGQLMASRIVLLNPLFTMPPLYETASSFHDILDSSMTCNRELTVVHPATLSAREFIIYQYGISILQFLRLHIEAPEINLCVASSIPLSNATGNAFRNAFFYQNSKNKLFILRDFLGSVGSFLLLLVHCFAHITATDFNEDSNPVFLRVFYQALKACFSEMFSLRLQMSAVLQGDKSSAVSEMVLKEEPFSKKELNLISQLFEVKVKSLTEMETFEEENRNLVLHVKLEELLSDKLSEKRKGFLHALNSYEKNSFEQRTCLEEENCTCFSPSELEDKVDVLTEELVNVVENEHHFLDSTGNEDLFFDRLESIGLERDHLVKQIEVLEEKIAQVRKF